MWWVSQSMSKGVVGESMSVWWVSQWVNKGVVGESMCEQWGGG